MLIVIYLYTVIVKAGGMLFGVSGLLLILLLYGNC